MDKHSKQAIQVFLEGGIVVYPTDTAFGIGCRIDNEASVDRLFTLRKRHTTHAVPVLVGSPEKAFELFDSPSDNVRRLIHSHWPGALTVVYHAKTERIYSPIRGEGSTVGLRMPNHSTMLSILNTIEIPVIGCSANMHGNDTPYEYDDLDQNLLLDVDFVLNGTCTLKRESTVVDCTKDPYDIVRQGALVL